jgi:hypothetical protein
VALEERDRLLIGAEQLGQDERRLVDASLAREQLVGLPVEPLQVAVQARPEARSAPPGLTCSAMASASRGRGVPKIGRSVVGSLPSGIAWRSA